VLLTPRDIPGVSAQGVHRRLAAAGDRLETLRIRHILTGAETLLRGVALFTYATPRRPRAWDASALEVRGVTVLRVGDAVAPRLMMSAVRDGQWAGETVQESCNSPAVSGVLTSSCSHGRNGVADGSA
jgi:hypothetical protein